MSVQVFKAIPLILTELMHDTLNVEEHDILDLRITGLHIYIVRAKQRLRLCSTCRIILKFQPNIDGYQRSKTGQ